MATGLSILDELDAREVRRMLRNDLFRHRVSAPGNAAELVRGVRFIAALHRTEGASHRLRPNSDSMEINT